MRDLEQRIKRNWTPPEVNSSKHIVVTFTIERDGKLLNHKITKSSGSPLADEAALNAIKLTSPFKPLPSEFEGQNVPIEFTFDYNVIDKNMSWVEYNGVQYHNFDFDKCKTKFCKFIYEHQ